MLKICMPALFNADKLIVMVAGNGQTSGHAGKGIMFRNLTGKETFQNLLYGNNLGRAARADNHVYFRVREARLH